ncbi:MAG: ABC transporter substrate-binding protein [Treponema sp.]|jgi:putative aldouronate transport system substrate-binding protein|nr:ABC transporter substrate-binding protein [Treponema sp.]
MKLLLRGSLWILPLCAALAFSFSSCGAAGQSGVEGVTVTIRIMNEFRNMDKVLARYKELTKDDPVMSKIHPRFKWVSGGDYKDKLSMALIAQEDYDLMFCGTWHGLTTLIQQESFAELSGYFNNDDYPGLQKAFPPDFVEAMTTYVRLDDGSYMKGIYGINLAEYFDDTRGILYREDLRKKYHCEPVVEEAGFIAYLDTVIAAEKEQAGKEWLGLNMYNFFRMDTPFYSGKHHNVFSQDSANILGDQTHVYIGLSDDRKSVLNAVFPGDAKEQFAKMPDGYRYDFISEIAVIRAGKWSRFLSPNRGTGDSEFREYLAVYCTLSNFESAVKDALTKYPDAEYGFYVIEKAQRDREEAAVICEMVTNNWLVVPEWSTKTEQVMRFLDWLFSSREHHDLFYYGLEGEDWEAIGEDGYRLLDIDEKRKYSMPVYSLALNPMYIRKSEFVVSHPDLEKRYDYMYAMSTYHLSPLAGFAFNPARVQTEVANVSALSNELQLSISKYDAAEALEKIRVWRRMAGQVGLENIRLELMEQLQEFLNAKSGGSLY